MLLLRPKMVTEALKKVEWQLVFFFVGLFVLIGVCGHEKVGVLREMGRGVSWLIDATGPWASSLLVWVTGILSGLTDNVPLAAMLAKMLPADTARDVWWSAIIGGNLVTLMKREGIRITFVGFMRTAAPFAVVQLLIGSLYLQLLRAVL